jgi:hypothetical protein
LDAHLTPDGRRYCWLGPRTPAAARRVEVWDIAAGRRVAAIPVPSADTGPHTTVCLDSSGRHVWVAVGESTIHHDLTTGARKAVAHFAHRAVGDRRMITVEPLREGSDSALWLSDDAGRPGWVALNAADPFNSLSLDFSPDGRQLAWATRSGTVYVTDLDALLREVAAFDRQFRSPDG